MISSFTNMKIERHRNLDDINDSQQFFVSTAARKGVAAYFLGGDADMQQYYFSRLNFLSLIL